MTSSRVWASCTCFTQRHIFLRQINSHVNFSQDDESFLKEYSDVLRGQDKAKILLQVKEEVDRRRDRFSVIERNREKIRQSYQPLHPHLYTENIDLSEFKFTRLHEEVYTGQVLDTRQCSLLLEELQHFTHSGLPRSQPNSMNRHGLLLRELGLDSLVEQLRARVEPVAREMFPDLVGHTGLDSVKAFTVYYDAESENHDTDLATHFDNAEVTLNIPLGEEAGQEEGELYFLGSGGRVMPVQHQRGRGVLHSGRALHGAMPLRAGNRTNLILWFRSSSVRNSVCPMCEQKPSLMAEPAGTADGFTLS